jgi:hypothetical protein
MTEKIIEMLKSDDVEMVNLGIQLMLETEPDFEKVREALHKLINEQFSIHIFPNIIANTYIIEARRAYIVWGTDTYKGFTLVKDPTKLLKLRNIHETEKDSRKY